METIADKETMKQRLTNFLYRKNVLEYHIIRLKEGVQVYNEITKPSVENASNNTSVHKMTVYEAKEKGENLAVELKNSIASYAYTKKQIEELSKNIELPEPEYIELNKLSEQLAEIELFGKAEYLAANIELPNILKSLKEYIDLNKKFLSELEVKLENSTDDTDKNLCNLLIFETKTKLIALEKRYSERYEYYFNTFLPQYNSDMNEHRKYFKKYMERARVLAKLNIDLPLKELLNQYEKNKDDKDNLWLFWTSLRDRVDGVIAALSEKKSELPKEVHNLLTKIR